jgi:hypothetical protein
MLMTWLPTPTERPRLAHCRAIQDAVRAASCAVKLARAAPREQVSQELLRTAEEQLDLARTAVERLT